MAAVPSWKTSEAHKELSLVLGMHGCMQEWQSTSHSNHPSSSSWCLANVRAGILGFWVNHGTARSDAWALRCSFPSSEWTEVWASLTHFVVSPGPKVPSSSFPNDPELTGSIGEVGISPSLSLPSCLSPQLSALDSAPPA